MSTTLQARTGRLLQRYENHFRLVAGCIPYRLKQNTENPTGDLLSNLEVLMITSPNRHDLVFPKGGWESDETLNEAACREALEEAGVRGAIHESLLGIWEFRSKSKQELHGQEGACRGFILRLRSPRSLRVGLRKIPMRGNG
ncbi:hypothetical protein HPP92_025309 [Vanilla planifolia]|uniref:Nudix hydrolase domain-containing protein n=1 Tax=Vanilla planifolia TaxID=51239 RepID=A0A835PF61_VANPL|nr:hypothetical protein HPP92_025309 [Vanilla planifolia]